MEPPRVFMHIQLRTIVIPRGCSALERSRLYCILSVGSISEGTEQAAHASSETHGVLEWVGGGWRKAGASRGYEFTPVELLLEDSLIPPGYQVLTFTLVRVAAAGGGGDGGGGGGTVVPLAQYDVPLQARPPAIPRLALCWSCTLNATGQSRVTLSPR